MLLIITCIAVLSNLFLGALVILKNSKSATHRLFLALTIIVSSWSIANYFSLMKQPVDQILFWIRIVMAVTSPMFPTIYLLSKAFPYKYIGISRIQLYAIILFVIITQVMAMTPLIFDKVEIHGDSVVPTPGPGIPLFAINFLGFLLLTLITLYKKNKVFKGLEKTQLRYLILGIVLTFFLGVLTNFIFVVVLKITTLVALGPLFSLILIGFISYSIIKHRFLDVGLIIARSIAYFLFIFIVFSFITFSLSIIGSYVTQVRITTFNLVTSVILALVVAFSFKPLERFLEKITEKIFYRYTYDSKEFLWNMSRLMASILDLSGLVETILRELYSEMKISYTFLILTREKSIIWAKGGGQVLPNPEFNEVKICELINYAVKSPGENILVYDEMVTESEEKKIMGNHKINVLLPLVVKEEIIGALIIGEKSSGEVYSSEDIEVLKIITPEIAVAVKNALSYEEIKRFNITLEQEVRQATENLTKANERLKQVDKMKDEFVSLASHELRTPMTVIKSYVWMLLEGKIGELNNKQKLYLERAYSSTDRLIKLVNDMLNVSRIESGRFSIETKDTDIKDLIKDTIAEMLPKAQEQGIALSFKDPSGTIPKVLADTDRTKEVLINLIGNSLKFTPKDGKIEVTTSVKDSMLVTKVTDTGAGIKKDDISKLFQKFGVVGDNYLRKQNSQGTGLGLYLSKSIVELQGGKMWVDSDGENKGSTFYFSLKPVATN